MSKTTVAQCRQLGPDNDYWARFIVNIKRKDYGIDIVMTSNGAFAISRELLMKALRHAPKIGDRAPSGIYLTSRSRLTDGIQRARGSLITAREGPSSLRNVSTGRALALSGRQPCVRAGCAGYSWNGVTNSEQRKR